MVTQHHKTMYKNEVFMAINPLGDNFTLSSSSSSHSRASRALRRVFEILCTPIALVMILFSSKDKPAVDQDEKNLLGDLPKIKVTKKGTKASQQAIRRFFPEITLEERKMFQ